MRRTLFMSLLFGLTLAACEPTTAPTTTIDPVLPPPDSIASTSTTTTAPSEDANLRPLVYSGFLPNGVDFIARVPGESREDRSLVGGWFTYDGPAGPTPVGEVRYTRLSDSDRLEASYDSGLLRLASGNWLVEVFFRGEVLTGLGDNAETTITKSVDLEVIDDWPVINLTPPFLWDVESPVRPTAGFERFLITIGCDSSAVACTDNGVAQVLALADGVPGSPDLSEAQRDATTIETSAQRSPFDPHYLDPGPLTERHSADLIWTGDEMIVWGGKTTRDGAPNLTDGATFDPETNQWQTLPAFPLEGEVPNRALWADGEMIVVSTDGTFAYDPTADAWREIGDGVMPSEWPERMTVVDGRLFVWADPLKLDVLDLATGEWELLLAPNDNVDNYSQFGGVVRSFRHNVIVVVNKKEHCEGNLFYRLGGETWQPLPEVSLRTAENADCSTANQSAFVSNDLFIWEEESHPTMGFSVWQNEWRTIDPIPLGGAEGASGPISMGEEHFMVPRWGEGAIFDATTDTWTLVKLPGQGTEREIIWTGTEFLAWTGTDAWRWTPDVGLIGGDDAA